MKSVKVIIIDGGLRIERTGDITTIEEIGLLDAARLMAFQSLANANKTDADTPEEADEWEDIDNRDIPDGDGLPV